MAAGETSGIAVTGIDRAAQNRIVQVLGANSTGSPGEANNAIAAKKDASAVLLQLVAQGAFFLSEDESCFQPVFPGTAVDTVAAETPLTAPWP